MGKQSTSPQYRSATPTVDAKCLPVCDAAIVTVSLTGPTQLLTPGFLHSVIDQQLVLDVPDELLIQRNIWCSASCLILDGDGVIEWGTQDMFDAGCATEVDLPATLSFGTAQKYLINAVDPVKIIAARGPCGQGVNSVGGGPVTIDELPPFEIPLGIASDVVTFQYCTDDENEWPVVLCKQADVATGEPIVWLPHVFNPTTTTLTPYTGPSKPCTPVTKTIVQVGNDLDLPGCPPVFACLSSDEFTSGECKSFDSSTKELVTVSNLGNPSSASLPDKCESLKGRLGVYVADGLDETVTEAQISALVVADLAANAATWSDSVVYGDAVATPVSLDAVDHSCLTLTKISVAQCGQEGTPFVSGAPAGGPVVVSEEDNVINAPGGPFSDGGSFDMNGIDFVAEDGSGFCVDYEVTRCFDGKSGALIEKNA